MTDPDGRIYYRNIEKNTTSWIPPTVEQIAVERNERNMREGQNMRGEEGEGSLAPFNTASAPPASHL